MAREDAGLNDGQESGGDIPSGKGVFPGLGLPVLPCRDDDLAAFVGEADCSAGCGLEVSGSELTAVEKGENEAVGENGAELFHEVEGEGRLAGADAVEETDVWVEADLFGGAVYEPA